jgi:hypothetical protein
MYKQLVVNSIETFTKEVSNIRDQWYKDEPLLPWCRGQERSEWALLPKLYRGTPDDLAAEFEIREEFATRAPALSDYTRPSENRTFMLHCAWARASWI